MAYIQDDKEEQHKGRFSTQEGKYSALLGGAAEGALTGGTTGGDAITDTSSGVKRPASAFVSMDRYLAANKGVVDKMNTDAKADLSNRADKVATGIKDATADFSTKANANTLAGPRDGTLVLSDNSVDVQKQAMLQPNSYSPRISRSQAEAKENASYAGPTSNDVNTRYNDLFSNYDSVRDDTADAKKYGLGAVNKWNGFDTGLSNADGGRDVGAISDKFGGIEKSYEDSRKTTDAALQAAAASYDNKNPNSAAGKWGAVGDSYDQSLTDSHIAAQKSADDAAKRDWDMTYTGLQAMVGGNPQDYQRSPGTRPTGEDFAKTVYPSGWWNQTSGANGKQALDKSARVFDMLTDDEAKSLMRINPSKSPRAFFEAMTNFAKKYGVK